MVAGPDDRHMAGILRAVKACLIHNTLLGSPSIDIRAMPLQLEVATR